jgi:hypothetical protein
MKNFFQAIALILVAAACASATSINITLSSPTVIAAAGNTVLVSGVVSNATMQTVYLNSISVTLNGLFNTDITPFFSGPISVDGLASTAPFDFFSVSVADPYTDPFGPMLGSFTIFGGADGFAGDLLGSSDFQVDVQAPEPASGGMLLLGLGAVAFFSRRRSPVL